MNKGGAYIAATKIDLVVVFNGSESSGPPKKCIARWCIGDKSGKGDGDLNKSYMVLKHLTGHTCKLL